MGKLYMKIISYSVVIEWGMFGLLGVYYGISMWYVLECDGG